MKYFVHTFQSDGHRKLGSFSTLIVDLKTLAGVRRRVHATLWFDTRLGYEIEAEDGRLLYRSPRRAVIMAMTGRPASATPGEEIS